MSLILLLLGDGARLTISTTVVRFVYAPFRLLQYRVQAGSEVFVENRRLYEELATLRMENQKLREAARENTRLRRLLGFLPAWEGTLVPAEVIGPLSPGASGLWIGAGSNKGVRENWPVVTEDGLLGRVVEVAEHVSRVRTLWDQLLRVAVYDNRSRVGGILHWQDGPNLQMRYVGRASDVLAGDTILSSGWGGVFPKGLLVGIVAAADTVAGSDFLDIRVAPAVRPDRLEEVFAIEPLVTDSADADMTEPAGDGR